MQMAYSVKMEANIKLVQLICFFAKTKTNKFFTLFAKGCSHFVIVAFSPIAKRSRFYICRVCKL